MAISVEMPPPLVYEIGQCLTGYAQTRRRPSHGQTKRLQTLPSYDSTWDAEDYALPYFHSHLVIVYVIHIDCVPILKSEGHAPISRHRDGIVPPQLALLADGA